MKKLFTTLIWFRSEIRMLSFNHDSNTKVKHRRNLTTVPFRTIYTATLICLFLALFTYPLAAFSENAASTQQAAFQLKEMLPLSWYLGDVQEIPHENLAFYRAAGDSEGMEVCAELLLTDNNQEQLLALDLFNPALGTLTNVEVLTQGMLMVNATNSMATGTEFMLVLNSILQYQLPDGSDNTLKVSNEYSQRTYAEYMAQEGFNAASWDTAEEHKVLANPLAAFQGQGKVQIPVKAQDLVDFQDAESDIDSDLKVKVCLTYHFTPN